MADPRYKNGIFTNTAALNRAKERATSNPLTYGWEFSHFRRWDDGDSTMGYTQKDFTITYQAGHWIVQYLDDEPVMYEADIASIGAVTKEVFKGKE